MDLDWYTYPNRTLCDTLEEMRKQLNNMQKRDESAPLHTVRSLVDEAQTYANRMESSMEDWSDVRNGHEKKKKLKKELKEMTDKKGTLEETINDLEAQRDKLKQAVAKHKEDREFQIGTDSSGV